jgi:hypothetical protein
MIAGPADFEVAAQTLGFPLVLKIPDSAFSRGVKKAENLAELKALATQWLEDSDLLIAQKFLPTKFDWRIGVLGGEPLFAVHYLMAKKHWQVVNHKATGKPDVGGFKTFKLKETPKLVVDTAVRAARCIGNGLYGVDLKETKDGVFVIEVNDNPDVDHGCEDTGEKDEVWVKLTQWFGVGETDPMVPRPAGAAGTVARAFPANSLASVSTASSDACLVATLALRWPSGVRACAGVARHRRSSRRSDWGRRPTRSTSLNRSS